ncbi:MAG: Bacterial SH3 domain protein [Firmicutes bacterium ADurb.Bin419]|nr:MAG: Bacterial SH3 domain protein [Firmicutes bacterium ADurb.Bin419]
MHTGTGDFQALRDSFNRSSYENFYEEKISAKDRIRNTFLSAAYILCTPIRFVIQHKKFAFIGLFVIYCFLCFFPYGKTLTYKYTGLDLMDEQAKAFYTVKGIAVYVLDEITDILNIGTSPQTAIAQTRVETIIEPDETTDAQFIITAKTGLNLREEPNTSSKKLLQLPFESIVTKEAEDGIWYKITTDDGISGWVSSEYLKEFRGD